MSQHTFQGSILNYNSVVPPQRFAESPCWYCWWRGIRKYECEISCNIM